MTAIANNQQGVTSTSPDKPVEVQPLRYGHIYRATKTIVNAADRDPLNRERRFLERSAEHVRISAQTVVWIRTKVSLTVGKGAAIIIASPPYGGSGGRKGPLARFADWAAKVLNRTVREIFPKNPEEVKRQNEFNNLMDEALAKTIGNRRYEMWYIDALCTEVASQGRGYGGALLDSVTTLADFLSQTTWLECSNADNVEFYNRHGFYVVAEVVVGERNPNWDGKPVVVSLMIREPKTTNVTFDER